MSLSGIHADVVDTAMGLSVIDGPFCNLSQNKRQVNGSYSCELRQYINMFFNLTSEIFLIHGIG